jgi:hypothetical protein
VKRKQLVESSLDDSRQEEAKARNARIYVYAFNSSSLQSQVSEG